jgi:hypothetical protein
MNVVHATENQHRIIKAHAQSRFTGGSAYRRG